MTCDQGRVDLYFQLNARAAYKYILQVYLLVYLLLLLLLALVEVYVRTYPSRSVFEKKAKFVRRP